MFHVTSKTSTWSNLILGQIPQMPQQVQCTNPIHPKKKISPITSGATNSQSNLGNSHHSWTSVPMMWPTKVPLKVQYSWATGTYNLGQLCLFCLFVKNYNFFILIYLRQLGPTQMDSWATVR